MSSNSLSMWTLESKRISTSYSIRTRSAWRYENKTLPQSWRCFFQRIISAKISGWSGLFVYGNWICSGALCVSEYPTKHTWSDTFYLQENQWQLTRHTLSLFFRRGVRMHFLENNTLDFIDGKQAIEYSIYQRRPISVMHICVRRPQ